MQALVYKTKLGALSSLLIVTLYGSSVFLLKRSVSYSTTGLLQNQIFNCLHYFLTEMKFFNFKCYLKKYMILVA